MKNEIRFKLKALQLTVVCCVLLSVIFASCKNDATSPTQNQNTGPQPTPIGTPNGIPVTATIGASGGSMISADSTVEFVIPAGALSSNTDITIQPITNFCWNSAGDAFRLTPEGQQFQQPVTIKFHYGDTTLAATLGDFMGIAHQDAAGYWHYMHDLTNDTVNRVISAPITHFSDWSLFDIAHLEPRQASVRVDLTVNLHVQYEVVTHEGDDLFYLPPSGGATIQSWTVYPPSGGGTIISHQDLQALYKAPSQVPQQNPVTVGANVQANVSYRGHNWQIFVMNSRIRIRPNTDITYDLRIEMNYNLYPGYVQYPCLYTDNANMVVHVSNNSVSISNITNSMPNVNPASGHFPNGQGSITWLPGDLGMINITTATGSLALDSITLGFTHSNCRSPHFYCVPPSGEPYYIGGEDFPGVPDGVSFIDADSTQSYYDPYNFVTATLTPRH